MKILAVAAVVGVVVGGIALLAAMGTQAYEISYMGKDFGTWFPLYAETAEEAKLMAKKLTDRGFINIEIREVASLHNAARMIEKSRARIA